MSAVKQMCLGNLQRKLSKRIRVSFARDSLNVNTEQMVGTWTGERSSYSVNNKYSLVTVSETNYPFKSKHWSKMCLI